MSKAERAFDVDISEARCRSCAVCWEVCEPRVLSWQPPLNKAIIVDLDACTGCRLCEWLCPDWAIVVRPRESGALAAAKPDAAARAAAQAAASSGAGAAGGVAS